MKPATPTEHQEQTRLFDLAKLQALRFHALHSQFAIPNRAQGTFAAATMMRKEGMKKGVPDIVFPLARGGYHSLYIELKRVNATPSDTTLDQLWWHGRLRAQCNCVCVKGFEAAKETVLRHLSGDS
jgi:hypothetical protein